MVPTVEKVHNFCSHHDSPSEIFVRRRYPFLSEQDLLPTALALISQHMDLFDKLHSNVDSCAWLPHLARAVSGETTENEELLLDLVKTPLQPSGEKDILKGLVAIKLSASDIKALKSPKPLGLQLEHFERRSQRTYESLMDRWSPNSL